MRMRALTFLAAAILGAAASLLVACGDRSHLIPSGDASELQSALDQVAAATSAGDCSTARRAVTRASSVLAGLPDAVDARLRARLRAGIANLSARVPDQCAQQTDTSPTTTPSTPTPSTPTQTQTPTTPTQTTTTPTQTTTTPAPTTATPPTTTPTAPPGNGNGNGNGNGGASPGGDG
jgi:cell division septation protein DedD